VKSEVSHILPPPAGVSNPVLFSELHPDQINHASNTPERFANDGAECFLDFSFHLATVLRTAERGR
jgi:hypothetical protein